MIIDGYEYGVLLLLEDEGGEFKHDFFFSNFEEMSDFMDDNCGNPEFCDLNAMYSIVEVIDGEPEPFCWTQDITLVGLVEGEAEEMIDEFRKWREENNKLSEAFNEKTKFTPEKNEYYDGSNEKYKWKDEYKYICPLCMEELNECTCKNYPYYLIQIDSKMVPIIRELNRKGYLTTSCCASHPFTENRESRCIYIGFKERYEFSVTYPSGGKYTRDGSLRYDLPEGVSEAQLQEFQEAILGKLLAWAKQL